MYSEQDTWLKLAKNFAMQSGLLTITVAARANSPERTIILTYRHRINGVETIEQITFNDETEFYTVLEATKEMLEKLENAEELLL